MFSSQQHAFYYITKWFKIAGFYTQKNFQKPNKQKPKKCLFPVPSILNIFPQKFQGLVLRLEEQIDAKGIDVAQPIWLSGCPT